MNKQPQFDRKRHGSLYDRGSADFYYHRGREPHWWPEGTGHGQKVTELTKEEIDEYLQGYEDETDQKDWR
jgi:hypothetical protein